METFLGMEVEQPGEVIRLHLDSYIQEVLTEYKQYIKKALRPKKVPMSPGLVLTNETAQSLLIRRNRSTIDHLSQSFSLLRHGFILMLLLQCQRLLDFVHPQVHRIRRHFIT